VGKPAETRNHVAVEANEVGKPREIERVL
jgi:hypothetical protein